MDLCCGKNLLYFNVDPSENGRMVAVLDFCCIHVLQCKEVSSKVNCWLCGGMVWLALVFTLQPVGL